MVLLFSIATHRLQLSTLKKVAGVGGFEPPNPGSKDLCLTA